MVVLVPDPDVVTPPGLLFNVQVPVAGNPFTTTLPVANAQVGCVVVPIVGVPGNAFTVNDDALVAVASGVVTVISPVVAPEGNVAVICVSEFTE